MKTSVLHGIAIAAWLVIGGSAWAQQATGTNIPPGTGNTTQPAAPISDQEPMQAQELAGLVHRDSSQPSAADISRTNASNYYRYNKRGVNCSLYPARCQGADN